MVAPRFIVFEGLDGAGTSTQVYKLRDFLLSRKVPVEVTREPTNGPIGSAIRLAVEGRVTLDAAALALAFAADRADHLLNSYNGISSILAKNGWVISDRYVLSSLAYQGIDIDDTNWLVDINRFAITPDLTIFVDTSVDICTQRIDTRSSHVELFHAREKLERVGQNFLKAIRYTQFTGKLVITDGSQDPDAVFRSYLPAIEDLIQHR